MSPSSHSPSHSENQQTYQRGANAAAVGLGVQLLLSIGMALLGVYSESPAIHAATWYLFGGLPIWICLLVLFHQHRLERIEALEAEQLARADARTAAIFDEAGQQLQLARQRLERMQRFGLPIVSVLVAGYLLIIGLIQLSMNWPLLTGERPAETVIDAGANTGVLALLLLLVLLIAFLVSRYVSGMTQVREWMMLRGGASYLMGTAVVAALLCLGAFLAFLIQSHAAMAIVAGLVPALMVVLGLEMLIGFLLGLYRPRRPGEFMRPAFDSRILGWLTRPESLGKIVSETLNYQFGFEISKSWFYQLLARAFTPLVVIGIVVLIALSSLVVVPPHQQAVITTFGANPRIAEPGAHVKWPWPIGQAEHYNVYRMHEVTVGSRRMQPTLEQVMLWDLEHPEGREEYLLTAPSRQFEEYDADTVAGELIGAQLVIKYRIADLDRYVRAGLNHRSRRTDGDEQREQPDGAWLLEEIAGREVSLYFAAHDINTLLSQNRLDAGEALRQRIQQRIDRFRIEPVGAPAIEGLGLEVTFVGIIEMHPPRQSDVADKFHEQIGAVQKRQTEIEEARRDAIGTLASVAGSATAAERLRELIAELSELEQSLEAARQEAGAAPGETPEALDELQQQVLEQQVVIQQALDDARGEAAQRIHDARAYRWRSVLREQGRVARFTPQLEMYRHAPDYFQMRHYLATLAEGLVDRRKIILAADQPEPPLIQMDLKSEDAGLQTILGTD